jgi:hypothetical protein
MKNAIKTKWILNLNDSDFEREIYERHFNKNYMTPKRMQILESYVTEYNEEWQYPYGVSPNGYAYNCGCPHDCCGCVSREYMNIEITRTSVILQKITTYNY